MKGLFGLLCLFMFMTSCDKDITVKSNDLESTTAKFELLKEYIVEGNLRNKYIYNQDSSISKIYHYSTLTGNTRSEYTYLANSVDELIFDDETQDTLEIWRYSWISDVSAKLSRLTNVMGHFTYNFESDGCGVKTITLGSSPYILKAFDYMDDNCSFIETCYGGPDGQTILSTREITHNNMPSGKIDKVLYFFGQDQLNGISSITEKDGNGDLKSESSTVYEYNEYGNPIKSTTTFTSGIVWVEEYIY